MRQCSENRQQRIANMPHDGVTTGAIVSRSLLFVIMLGTLNLLTVHGGQNCNNHGCQNANQLQTLTCPLEIVLA